MRQFDTGATRDNDENKIDFEGFLSPVVLQLFGEYMQKHQVQADGKLRPSDNWQKGIPKDAYMKSMLRHVHDVWMNHRGYEARDGIEDALCAVLFNVQGYLYELMKEKDGSLMLDLSKMSADEFSNFVHNKIVDRQRIRKIDRDANSVS